MCPGSVSPNRVNPLPLLSLDTRRDGPISFLDTWSDASFSTFCDV